MQPRIETLEEKKFIGIRIKTSFADNKTAWLWSSFMPRRGEISNSTGPELYSIEIYPEGFFGQFNAEKQFEKWAAIEVENFASIPGGMETMIVPGGLYTVFLHKGPASTVPQTYQYILSAWLPRNGDFMLDERPHIAVMGKNYKNEDPDSEEALWIPVKKSEVES